MSDFESACIKAIKLMLSEIATSACFFHLLQSFRRQAGQKEIIGDLNNDSVLMFQFKMLKLVYMHILFMLFYFRAISFVPAEDVCDVWEKITSSIDERLNPIIDWFEGSYIGNLLINLKL